MFRLAQVTDPHFRSFTGATPGQFLNKRAIGALNLVVNRVRKHRMELLADMAEDLRARRVDHLAVTGDLGNISIEPEWLAARRWIEGLAMATSAITVIPGNHDAYVPEVVEAQTFEKLFADYQTAELRPGPGIYPFARIRAGVALVAVNSCVPTGDLGAWGAIGPAQLERLEALLTAPELRGHTRVVMLHHPPVLLKPPESRNLRDRADFVALLGRAGADLVIHGHDHLDERAVVAGPGGRAIPVVGAGSASYAGGPEKRSRYNVYEISYETSRPATAAATATITAVTYAHDEPSDAFKEVRRVLLTPA